MSPHPPKSVTRIEIWRLEVSASTTTTTSTTTTNSTPTTTPKPSLWKKILRWEPLHASPSSKTGGGSEKWEVGVKTWMYEERSVAKGAGKGEGGKKTGEVERDDCSSVNVGTEESEIEIGGRLERAARLLEAGGKGKKGGLEDGNGAG